MLQFMGSERVRHDLAAEQQPSLNTLDVDGIDSPPFHPSSPSSSSPSQLSHYQASSHAVHSP